MLLNGYGYGLLRTQLMSDNISFASGKTSQTEITHRFAPVLGLLRGAQGAFHFLYFGDQALGVAVNDYVVKRNERHPPASINIHIDVANRGPSQNFNGITALFGCRSDSAPCARFCVHYLRSSRLFPGEGGKDGTGMTLSTKNALINGLTALHAVGMLGSDGHGSR